MSDVFTKEFYFQRKHYLAPSLFESQLPIELLTISLKLCVTEKLELTNKKIRDMNLTFDFLSRKVCISTLEAEVLFENIDAKK